MTSYSKKKILSGHKVSPALPKNLKEGDAFLFSKESGKDLPDVFLFELNNVNVSPAGILFKGFTIFKQFFVWPKHSKEFNTIYLIRNYLRRKRKTLNGTTIICFDYWSMGYFHWMCDFLPRLVLMENYLKDTPVLLPENHSLPFIEQSLKAFGITTLVRFSENTYVHCKRALVPGHITKSGDHNPAVMQRIKEKLIDFYKPQNSPATFHKNIYVSRAKSQGRFIINEKEVIALLEKYDFKTIFFEDYSFPEQMAIAWHARNLIGLHGANLTNVIFMQPGSNLLEFRKKNDPDNNYYFTLASTFQVNYYYLTCDYKENAHEQRFDVLVDLEELEKNLVQLNTRTY